MRISIWQLVGDLGAALVITNIIARHVDLNAFGVLLIGLFIFRFNVAQTIATKAIIDVEPARSEA